jgi:hypothetical protein
MNMKRVKDEAIRHYNRMIAWAEKQPPYEFPNSLKMKKKLGESWYGYDCPFCNALRKGDGTAECEECPLYLAGKACQNLTSPWAVMAIAETWEDWIQEAKRLRDVIRALPE